MILEIAIEQDFHLDVVLYQFTLPFSFCKISTVGIWFVSTFEIEFVQNTDIWFVSVLQCFSDYWLPLLAFCLNCFLCASLSDVQALWYGEVQCSRMYWFMLQSTEFGSVKNIIVQHFSYCAMLHNWMVMFLSLVWLIIWFIPWWGAVRSCMVHTMVCCCKVLFGSCFILYHDAVRYDMVQTYYGGLPSDVSLI